MAHEERGRLTFRDLAIGERFVFVADPDRVLVKTSATTYSGAAVEFTGIVDSGEKPVERRPQ
jgi:hypothetical protein